MRRTATLIGLVGAGGAVVLLAGTTGSATAGVAGAPPTAARATPVAPSQAAVTAVHRYRLITGQTLLVRTRADGTSTPRLQGGGPFVWGGGPDTLDVIPRMAASRLRGLDVSLFDATALARVVRHGRTPVVVRLKGGDRRPSLPGLRLTSSRAQTAGRGAVLGGSYGPHFRGLDARALRGVSSIRLDVPPSSSDKAAPTGPTHTVTVHVTTKSGHPTDYGVVDLANTVDSDTYFAQAAADPDGVATFKHVPEGQYSVLVGTFAKVLVNSQFDVAAETALEMSLGDATVKPHATLGSRHLLSTATTVQRDPESGFPISWGSVGSPHFDLRLPPTSGVVDHGDLNTGASANFVTGRSASGYDSIAMTADAGSGVPADLTFVHHRKDFARMTDVIYGNGPATTRPLWLIPGNAKTWASLADLTVQVPVPGRVRVWTQAGPHQYLQQTLFPFQTASSDNNTQIGEVRAYHHAGALRDHVFLHGPVGPGLELAPDSPYSSGTRRGDQLTLSLPTINGAGHSVPFEFADNRDASWSLHVGRSTLARGHQWINTRVDVPHGPRTYRLLASSHPGKTWDLSTHVDDLWTFHSRAGHHAVALVTPSYVPPTDLSGNLAPGRTGFRLTFHSTHHSARIAHATVELSTNDGRTWRDARVTRTSALTFRVHYRNPAAHGDLRYLSLRVTSRDIHGNSNQETAIHAYRLR
jgi:hypothetical protein